MSQETVFEKILAGSLSCQKVYEDAYTLAFHDIEPQAPIHVLIIPKKKFSNLNDVEESDALLLGHLFLSAKKVAQILGLQDTGYRLICNNGSQAGQSVFYLHCHVIGGLDTPLPFR